MSPPPHSGPHPILREAEGTDLRSPTPGAQAKHIPEGLEGFGLGVWELSGGKGPDLRAPGEAVGFATPDAEPRHGQPVVRALLKREAGLAEDERGLAQPRLAAVPETGRPLL